MPSALRLTPAVLAVAALAACAPNPGPAGLEPVAAPGAPTPCFNVDRVTNFRSGPAQTLYIRTFPDAVFELRAEGNCTEADFALSMVLRPAPGFTNRLCVGDRAQAVVSPARIDRQLCRLRVVRALSPAEVEALPSRDRP